MLFSTLIELALVATLSSAAVLDRRQSTTTVGTFSSPKSAEGIAERSNGQLLVSFFDKGELWSLDPATKKTARLVTFTDATCSAGIAEIAPDVFAVVAGQYSGGNKPGSWGIWKVTFSGDTATASLLKKVPESGMFNGLTAFSNDTILIGDATKGAIYRMNINTGDYSIAIQDATMTPGTGIPMGIDGLRYSNGTVYFTNISKNTLMKVPVDSTGKSTGAITPIWSNTIADDMAAGPDGSLYVATSTNGKIQKVAPDGKISTVASIGGSTSCTLGRTSSDKNTLYIATNTGAIGSVKI